MHQYYQVVYNPHFERQERGIPFDEIAGLKEVVTVDMIERAIFTPPEKLPIGMTQFSTGSGHWDKALGFLMSTMEHNADLEHCNVLWTVKSIPCEFYLTSTTQNPQTRLSRVARWFRMTSNDDVMIGVITPHYYHSDRSVDHRFCLYSNNESFHPIAALMLDYFIEHSKTGPRFSVG